MTELSTTSSIGACWPPEATTQERRRGLYDHAVMTMEDVQAFAERYHEEAQIMRDDPGTSRLSIRLVANVEMVAELERQGVPVEGALQFSWFPEGETPYSNGAQPRHALVYTGENTLERDLSSPQSAQTMPELPTAPRPVRSRRQLQEDAAHVNSRLIESGLDPIEYHEITGGEVRALELADSFMPLWSETFGYDREEIEAILTNPDNHIVYAQNEQGGIVSVAMAELDSISVEGVGRVNLAEITEASTLAEYQGHGLYGIASGLLLLRLGLVSRAGLTSGTGPLHLVYGESNLSSPGVLLAANHNGRVFAAHELALYDRDEMILDYFRRRAMGRPEFGM